MNTHYLICILLTKSSTWVCDIEAMPTAESKTLFCCAQATWCCWIWNRFARQPIEILVPHISHSIVSSFLIGSKVDINSFPSHSGTGTGPVIMFWWACGIARGLCWASKRGREVAVNTFMVVWGLTAPPLNGTWANTVRCSAMPRFGLAEQSPITFAQGGPYQLVPMHCVGAGPSARSARFALGNQRKLETIVCYEGLKFHYFCTFTW